MKFRLIAGTNVGLRDNNEDNFVVSPDLHDGKWIIPADVSIVHEAKDKGVLLVVADGMGGQNAGEVASEIAISTMQEMFAPQSITKSILRSEASIKSYLKQCIVEADKRIKHRSRIDPETANMGSTIVIAWIIGYTAYIAWLGDSRAYSIIPNKGIIGRISKDHSYVQKLVDLGKITEKAAMTHPDSNIITRSLGDPNSTAKPDVVTHPLEKDEIILLCSDGLCGFVEDEVIGAIIKEANGDFLKCKQDLMSIALKCGSNDNITIALFQAVDSAPAQKQTPPFKRYLISIICMIAVVATIVLSFKFIKHLTERDKQTQTAEPAKVGGTDSVKNAKQSASTSASTAPAEELPVDTTPHEAPQADESVVSFPSIDTLFPEKDSIKQDSIIINETEPAGTVNIINNENSQ